MHKYSLKNLQKQDKICEVKQDNLTNYIMNLHYSTL